MQPHPERRWDDAGAAHPSDHSDALATGCGQPTPAGIHAGAGGLGCSPPVLPVGCSLPNYWEIVFITVLTLFLTLFFSWLLFHSLINFGIFLTVYNPCHGCHGNRRECAQR